ncbi:MAG: AbrB/MazE/SpoVT family DNA-binding domain-containing protein [Cyanobacteriota bacterium]|nr:AbrB/MazE/SpoVT family DNA-binding domain-containing protein [Cyanobacteriota bacterium]
MTFAPETNVNIRQFPVRLQPEGVISIPSAVREKLHLTEGDMLALVQVGDVFLLANKTPQVTKFADKMVSIMEAEGVSLQDLLEGLEMERQIIWEEQQKNG